MAAGVAAAPEAPAAVAAAAAAAARPTRKRTRIAMGSTDDYEEETCCLGKGAFGSVHKARHRGTGRTVAIKRLAAEAAGSKFELMREASLLEAAGRDNPYVVGCHGLARRRGTLDDDLCLVMECVVGSSLGSLLQQRRSGRTPRLPEATVREVMRQLLTGAEKMHAAHVVHRDIKPDNILVTDDRTTVKICDFGLAMHLSEPPPYDAAGTLSYMAPEVLLGMPDYDALVDAWSLGCVMAELVDGSSPPFVASNTADQLRAIFDVLGLPDASAWPWFSSKPFASKLLKTELNIKGRNLLRKKFPRTKLSVQGFQVLSGLLTCNPDKRLTTAAALKHPWFAKMDAPELPKKLEVPSTLPKIKRLRVVCP